MTESEREVIDLQMFKDFGKTKEDLKEYVDILGKWAELQAHFPEKPSYAVLRGFILYNKFGIEKAKQKLDMYYTARGLLPDFFSFNPFMRELDIHRKMWQIIPLPKLAENNIRILYHRMNPDCCDPNYFDQAMEFAYFFNVIELIILDDYCYRLHYVFDMAGTKLAHLKKVSPVVVKNVAFVLEKVYSNNLSSIYLVNFPPIFETMLNTLVKPVLNPKLRNRIKVSTGTDILLEDFGKSRMPQDVGGDEKPLKGLCDDLMKKFEKHRNRFDTLVTLKVDESLRPAKLENNDVLGYYGNFKKLNVD